MSVVGSLIFCTNCGNLLPSVSTSSKTLDCELCHRQYPSSKFTNLKVVTKTSEDAFPSVLKSNKSVVKTKLGKQDLDEGATIKEKCPQCGNEEMSYHTLQLRSADEGATVFYTCTKSASLTTSSSSSKKLCKIGKTSSVRMEPNSSSSSCATIPSSLVSFKTLIKEGTVTGLQSCPNTYAISCLNNSEWSRKPVSNSNSSSSVPKSRNANISAYLSNKGLSWSFKMFCNLETLSEPSAFSASGGAGSILSYKDFVKISSLLKLD